MELKNSMVIYQTMYQQFKRLMKFNPQSAVAYMNAVLEYGFEGKEPPEDSEVWLYGFDTVKVAVDNAAVRYLKAQENGKKGGRPKQDIDPDQAYQLYNELKSWDAVAKYLGIGRATLFRYKQEWESDQSQNQVSKSQNLVSEVSKSQNLVSKVSESQKSQNLNININTNINKDIDINRAQQLKEEFCADGYSTKLDTWLKVDDTATRQRLYTLGYNDTDIDYVFSNIIE